MNFANYPYNNELCEILASVDKQWRLNNIAIYQGRYANQNFYHTWLAQANYTNEGINRIIDELCKENDFKVLILNREKKNYGEISWEAYITQLEHQYSKIFPINYNSWQCVLLDFLYGWYREDSKQSHPEYHPNNPLEVYYKSKGIDLELENNYGLIDVSNFDVKLENGPKLYDKRLDTHIIIEEIPQDFLTYLIEERKKTSFKLTLRPNYEICGDGLMDVPAALEHLIQGSIHPMLIDQMPPLTWLCDDTTSSDRLIVSHDKKLHGITFEELVGDPLIEDDYVVSQVVHFMYTKENGSYFINHLDHEYVFYTADEHTEKLENLKMKGERRERYKTFKIDNAHIVYRDISQRNIIYRTLDAYFSNKDLLKEYFDGMINKKIPSLMRWL